MGIIEARLSGIGQLVRHTGFTVPDYQRPYAWDEEQVADLYRAIYDAHNRRLESCFLGTIVSSATDNGHPRIIDGQQRLVTVSILVAAIRDYFVSGDQPERTHDIEQEYLSRRDIRSRQTTARLQMIPDDHDFFVSRIVRPPDHPDRATKPRTAAQHRIAKAARYGAAFVGNLTATTQSPSDVLVDLLEFIDSQVQVILVTVADEAGAFAVFQVLSDRGIDLSVGDWLKSALSRSAGDRLDALQTAWADMTRHLSDSRLTDDRQGTEVSRFIHQHWIARNGFTPERHLLSAITRQMTTPPKVIDYCLSLAADAPVYAALGDHGHDRWKSYGNGVSDAVEAVKLLGATSIKPLLLAIVTRFAADEVENALPTIAAWAVRFLICGTPHGRSLERLYAERGKDVSRGKITTAAGLCDAMAHVLPSDAMFEQEFATAQVAHSELAKYWLRVLEAHNSATHSALILDLDLGTASVEHVLPQSSACAWSHVPQDQHSRLVNRLGNLTLMTTPMSAAAACSSFEDKKKLFATSRITITQELASLPQWSGTEIEARQRAFAKLAVKAWSNTPPPRAPRARG